jgi:hypothetical protein
MFNLPDGPFFSELESPPEMTVKWLEKEEVADTHNLPFQVYSAEPSSFGARF